MYNIYYLLMRMPCGMQYIGKSVTNVYFVTVLNVYKCL